MDYKQNPIKCCLQETHFNISTGELKVKIKKKTGGTSLVVQWLRLCAPNAGGLGSIPGQGTRSHMQSSHVAMKILCVATKTRCSQVN